MLRLGLALNGNFLAGGFSCALLGLLEEDLRLQYDQEVELGKLFDVVGTSRDSGFLACTLARGGSTRFTFAFEKRAAQALSRLSETAGLTAGAALMYDFLGSAVCSDLGTRLVFERDATSQQPIFDSAQHPNMRLWDAYYNELTPTQDSFMDEAVLKTGQWQPSSLLFSLAPSRLVDQSSFPNTRVARIRPPKTQHDEPRFEEDALRARDEQRDEYETVLNALKERVNSDPTRFLDLSNRVQLKLTLDRDSVFARADPELTTTNTGMDIAAIGDLFSRHGRLELAVECTSVARDLLSELETKTDLQRNKLIECSAMLGGFNHNGKGQALLEEALALLNSSGNAFFSPLSLPVHRGLFSTYHSNGERQKAADLAMETAEQTLKHTLTLPADRLFEWQELLAQMFSLLVDQTEAERWCRLAQETSLKGDNIQNLVAASKHLAVIYNKGGNPEKMVETIEHAMQSIKTKNVKMTDANLVLLCKLVEGLSQELKDEVHQRRALVVLNDFLELAKQSPSAKIFASLGYFFIGRVYNHLREFDASMKFLLLGEEVAYTAKARVLIYSEIARAKTLMQLYQEAIDSFDRAIDLVQSLSEAEARTVPISLKVLEESKAVSLRGLVHSKRT